MRLQHDLEYAADPTAVLAMVTDPAFWDKVAVATEAISSVATAEADGAATRIVIDQELKVVGVPSFAKKFVGDSTRSIITQVWSGSTAAYEIDTPGKPTSLTGTLKVAPRGSGSTLTYDVEVRASVPLIGGKLEKLVIELFTEGLAKEQSVGNAWLAGER